MNKTERLDLILFGYNKENDEFSYLNTIITKFVQNFIVKTRRFD